MSGHAGVVELASMWLNHYEASRRDVRFLYLCLATLQGGLAKMRWATRCSSAYNS
jgi:hypothetical protein